MSAMTTHELQIYDPSDRHDMAAAPDWYPVRRDMRSKPAARRLAEHMNLCARPGEERKYRIVTRTVLEDVEYL